MNKDLIEWYCELPKNINNVKNFCEMLPFCNLIDPTFKIEQDGINNILNTLLNDKTILITTKSNRCNISHNNILYINHSQKEIPIKDNQNIIFYLQGVNSNTGEIIHQKYFEYIKSKFQNSKIVLDDTDGMFIVPRDYSIFDYVVCNCNNLIDENEWLIINTTDHSNENDKCIMNKISKTLSNDKKLIYFKNTMKSLLSEYLYHNSFYYTYFDSVNHMLCIRLNTNNIIEDKLPKDFELVHDNNTSWIILNAMKMLKYDKFEFEEILKEFIKFLEYYNTINQFDF